MLRPAIALSVAICASCTHEPIEAPPRYVVDVFVMGPAVGTEHAAAYVADAEDILGLEIVLHADPRPGVLAVTLADPSEPDGYFHCYDPCHCVAWANSGHSLAHEIGHYGGLQHNSMEGNLMAQPVP